MRTLTVSGAVLTALAGVPMAALADGWGTVDCGQRPTPQCELVAGHTPGPPAASGGSDASTGDRRAGASGGSEENLPACGYQPSEFQGYPGPPGTGWLPPGTWYEGVCSLDGAIENPVLVPSLSATDVARLARGQLGLPAPRIATSPTAEQLVRLPTWLWLDNAWEAVSATASVPGVIVTATARPRSVTWAMGDGHTLTCTGPGTRFRPEGDPGSASPDCGHIYRRSSASQRGGRYAVTATVHWSVSWSGAGQSGTFPDLTTTSTNSLRVGESQALNVPPPR